MIRRVATFKWHVFGLVGCIAASLLGMAAVGQERLPGYRPTAFVLQGGRIVPEPGRAIENGTLVMRDGLVEAVGPAGKVPVPADAERVDVTGLVVYPGFIDGYNTSGVDSQVPRSRTGPGRRVDYGAYALASSPPDRRVGLTPEFEVADAAKLDDQALRPYRAQGFTARLLAPAGGIVTGQSALVSLGTEPRRESIMRAPVAMHVALRPTGKRGYPTTLMGYVAHLRQAVADAEHYERLVSFWRQHGGPRPPRDPAWQALRLAATGRMPVFWQADTREEIHRALDLADEFGMRPVIVGGRQAWKVARRLAKLKVPVVLRLDFPDEPKEPSKEDKSGRAPEAKRHLPTSRRLLAERQRLWAERVSCAAVLAKRGVRFCFTTDGLSKPEQFRAKLRQVIEHGLAPSAALAALTRDAAAITGMAGQLGVLRPGAAAHVTVMTAPLQDPKAKVRYVFIDRDKYEIKVRGGKKAAEEQGPGSGQAAPKRPATTSKRPEKPPAAVKSPPAKQRPEAPKAAAKPTPPTKPTPEPFPTEIEADRKPTIRTGGNVAIRNATILTVTKGTVPKGTILVRNGKIAAVGENVPIPQGVAVIDADGLYVMPGIIDTHCHFSISGGVNEASLSVVPEVRVADVVNGADLTIYRALSGGVTTARLLHGSANCIGGQHAVIKLRWGQPGRELIVRGAPAGIKFALGENPKRSSGRYPDTRLGVESTIRRAFEEARAYQRRWQHYAGARSRGRAVPEPRRDLRLQTLLDVLQGRISVHCHCYRADEILMLLNLADAYGIQIRSLQHVLEGYQVAAEIAAHGASCSTFSDWWAYKMEAYDAIPYNAALLTRAGAKVCIKSDNRELMRHLYQEAAKTLRYGGLTVEQALATITINGAEQLGLADRIGSIEVGKDADLAIFNGHPLNGYARCEMTLIDGEVYFERKGEHKGSGYGSPVPPPNLRRRRVNIAVAANGTYALKNAHIVPVVGKVIEKGTLVIADGKIRSVGGPKAQVPKGAKAIDLGGLFVFPGMINAGGSLGLIEVGYDRETHDYRERGSYNEDICASVALHPDSEWIPVSRAGGVLAALSQPTGGTISGQSALINLYGWIPSEMVLIDRAALHVNFPRGLYEVRSGRQSQSSKGPSRRERAAEAIRALKRRFRLAVQYDKLRGQRRRKGLPPLPADPRLEALAPYALGRKPVVIHANRHGDILAAIDFAEELKLNWILADAAEAWKCPQELKRHKVRVLLGPSMQLPSGPNVPYDMPYRNAAVLHEAGVPFAIKATLAGPGSATSTRNLPFQAAMAVAYGLPPDEGLKAVTLYPAQILGVADRLGSIEPGKLANLVICDGDLLQPATQIKYLFIAGQPVPATSRHTRLYHRYLRRLRQVRAGKAKLGVRDRRGLFTRSPSPPASAPPANRR